MRPCQSTTRAVTTAVAGVWLLAVVSVMVRIIDYSNTPARAVAPPPQWPAHTQIPLDANGSTLVLFAHPRCPCTRATLGELERLLASCAGRLSAHVVFIRPVGTADDWAKTGLWREASALPGVSVHLDDAGAEARRFHCETSGQTVLYDRKGRLTFQGGITIARGHSGDNPGRSALLGLLEASSEVSGQTPEIDSERATQSSLASCRTPVFGCSLFAIDRQEEATQCDK